MGREGFRISGYAPASGVVALGVPFLRRSLAGARLDPKRHERRGRLAEVGQLPDDAPRNDVKVVVAVVTSLVGDVVIANDDDVFGSVFPQESAGQFSQPVGFEILGKRSPRVGGDVLPLDGHEWRRDLVHSPSLYDPSGRSLLGTRRFQSGTSAYRAKR